MVIYDHLRTTYTLTLNTYNTYNTYTHSHNNTYRRYAQLICSVITLQSGSDWGVGGGGETMVAQDVISMRTEMIGKALETSALHI